MKQFNPATADPRFKAALDRLRQSKEISKQIESKAATDRQIAERLIRPIPTLHKFVVDSWENVIHPSEVFKSGWYIEYFCEWLTVVTIGTLNAIGDYAMRDRLLEPFGKRFEDLEPVLVNGVEWDLTHIRYISFNISPRCSKSTVITIDWPCWEWLVMPWLPFLTLSYDQALASDHSDLRRSIIRSEYYQKLSGGMKLSNSKNRITEYANEHRGQMVAKGFNAGVVGGGGVRIVIDDGNDPNKAESDTIRNKATKSFKEYKDTRQNDPKLTAVVNVQQRTHELDISGTIGKEYPEFVQIIIPMETEYHERITFPLSGKVIERSPGDQMHPDRFPEQTISGLKRDPRIWAGRYQQRPTTSGGGLFQIRDWRLFNPRRLPDFRRSVLSLDCSFKDLNTSSYNALGLISETTAFKNVTLPRTYTDRDTGQELNYSEKVRDYYLRAMWRERADITETEAALQQFAADYPEALVKLIEDKANGTPIISRFKNVLLGIEPINPRGSKEERAMAIQPIHRRGGIYLPIDDQYCTALEQMGIDSISIGQWWDINPPKHEADAEFAPVPDWVKIIINEFAKFPRAANNDTVDMLDQAIIWMSANAGSTSAGKAATDDRTLAQRTAARRQHRPVKSRAL